MKQIITLLFAVVALSISSCKQDTKPAPYNPDLNDAAKSQMEAVRSKKSDENVSNLDIIKNMQKVTLDKVPHMKSAAEAILQHRTKELNRKAWQLLDNRMWEYEYIFNGKQMSKPGKFSDHWLDFTPELTYTYGVAKKEKGSGRYIFNQDTGVLLMIDNSDNIKPQEFTLKLMDEMMIMGGTNIYQDNNYQAKLRRIDENPS